MIAKVLIVDDHPLIVQGYKELLLSSFDVTISVATSQVEAQQLLQSNKLFDVVIVDLSLPDQNDYGYFLSNLIKQKLPECTLVVITSHFEALVIYNLVKFINPQGVILKSDLTAERFTKYFHDILAGYQIYSPSVHGLLNKLKGDEYLDNYNRMIIIKLSQGVLSKNLPKHLPLSMSAIDKRKVQIKTYLGIEKGSDEDIINEAKKRGLL